MEDPPAGSSKGGSNVPSREEFNTAIGDLSAKLESLMMTMSQVVHGTAPAATGDGGESRGGKHTAPGAEQQGLDQAPNTGGTLDLQRHREESASSVGNVSRESAHGIRKVRGTQHALCPKEDFEHTIDGCCPSTSLKRQRGCSSGGEETSLKGMCLVLRAATLEKQMASRSPGFYGNVPSGIGRQPLSKFRLTYGQQVQSRFRTAPTPVFGSSQRPPLTPQESRYVPGPGHYAWHKNDLPIQPGTKFGSAAQRPGPGKDTGPGPNQYSIPSTLGTTIDSKFRNVVAPGFGPLPKAARSRTAAAYWGVGSGGPGPGQYDVDKMFKNRSCSAFKICAPTGSSRVPASTREGKREELDPEKIKRAVKLTKKGCRIPDVSFGSAPQRPVERTADYPGPQAYDPASLRRGMSASRSSSLREFKFGTGPQRHNTFETDKSPGPNADYKIPSTMGPQMNSIFKSVSAPSFGTVTREALSKKGARYEPGPASYRPTFANLPQTTYVVSFHGGSTRDDGGRKDISPGPGAYKLDSGLGPQTSSKYKSSPAPSLRAR